MQLNKLLHCLACFYLFILMFFFSLLIKDLANLKPGSAPNGATCTSRTNYVLCITRNLGGTVCLCRLNVENLSLHALLSPLPR